MVILYWLGSFISLSAVVGSAFGVMLLGTFESWLSLATALTGFVWFVCKIIHTKKNQLKVSDAEKPFFLGNLLHGFGSFFPVLLFVFVLRGFIVEPFRIPSGSMLPTLYIGDFVLVNKFAYGLRLPIIGERMLGSAQPERGDVTVFRFPGNVKLDYIKRIVGLPGDTITLDEGKLYINDEAVPLEELGLYEGDQAHLVGGSALLGRETLGHRVHEVLNDVVGVRVSGSVKVPDGHYFVLGDNRDHSSDSRVWGFVPDQALKGKAFFIWLNWGERFDYSRIGTMIQ